MRTSIFCPNKDGLKFDLRTTLTSILVRPTSRTSGITRNGREISFVVRYLHSQLLTYVNRKKFIFTNTNYSMLLHNYFINSNSPSGGIKEMECSVSNLDSFTHWWNWQSSITTTGFPDRTCSSVLAPFPLLSITSLSLIPNLHSGIPERKDFMMTFPATWADKTCPEIQL